MSHLICTQKAVTPSQHQIDFLLTKNGYIGIAHKKRLHWHIGIAHKKRLHWHNVKFDFAQEKRLQKQYMHFKHDNFNGIAQRDSVSAPLQLNAICH